MRQRALLVSRRAWRGVAQRKGGSRDKGDADLLASTPSPSPYAAENNLSFIETSALDASNVEQAFQNILTGE